MKPNLFHTQFFRLFFLILLAGISIQTYAAKDSQAAPKKRTITGTVISEGDNMPIIGANVWLKNSSTGAITDLDGKYSITIDNSVVGGVLVFSYIGMSTQEVAIGNQNVINVTLKFDTEKIDEVVVVGYGHQKKASVIGSISTIDMAGSGFFYFECTGRTTSRSCSDESHGRTGKSQRSRFLYSRGIFFYRW